MQTLKAKSVRLYLEGLMILSYNCERKILEAGIHSQAHCHTLEINTYERMSASSKWKYQESLSFTCEEICQFKTGRIFIEHGESIMGSEVELADSYCDNDGEAWSPFNAIPSLTEILGIDDSDVTLNYDVLKPAVEITAGKFHSVFYPLHLKKEENRSTETNLQSYLANREHLREVRERPPESEHINNLSQLEEQKDVRKRNLGVRSYTAAAILSLSEDKALVGQLEKAGDPPETKNLFKVGYDQDREIKIVVRNVPPEYIFVPGSRKRSQNLMERDDHAHADTLVALGERGIEYHSIEGNIAPYVFHSLHFYNAIINPPLPEKQNVLGTESLMVDYANGGPFVMKTGAHNPNCPMGRRP